METGSRNYTLRLRKAADMFMPTKITCIVCSVKTEGRTKYLKCDVPGCDSSAKLVDAQ